MKNNDENIEHEQMMESFYRYVGYQHIENVAKEFDEISEMAKDIEYPKELDDWFYDYFEKSKIAEMKKKRTVMIKRMASRVAIVTIILGIGLTVMTVSVEAFRIKFLNLVTDITQKYTSIQIEEIKNQEEDFIPISWSNYYLPEYIADGYSLNRVEAFGENKIVFYQNSKGVEIQFSQSPNHNNYQVDTENAETTEIIINGFNGILVSKNGNRTLFWHNAEYAFYLMGSIDQEEIIEMAESTKIK